jgi:hypothetical protein
MWLSNIYDEEAGEEEEVICADQGESLVVYRSLSAALVDEDDSIENNSLHTKCISHGKVCNIIIDGGDATTVSW